MVFKFTDSISGIFFGKHEISRVYLGTTIVYQKKAPVQNDSLIFNKLRKYNSGFFYNKKE